MTNKKWTTENIPDQSGKFVIITGANSGIGFEAARTLVEKGATVIMACRNLEKANAAEAKILAETPKGQTKVMQLDLSDLKSVRAFTHQFLAEYNQLDILINNAGVMATPKWETADGFEGQFGTNHLGHFALTGLLIDVLRNTPNSRVVTVSSYAHILGWIRFNDLNSEKFYSKWLAYGQSKLANILFAYELQRKLAQNGSNPISMAVHPGYAATNLQHHSWFWSILNPILAQSQEMGALPTLYAATHPDIQGGEYIGPDGFLAQRGYPHIARSSPASHNQKVAKKLWRISEEMTGVTFDV